MFSWRNKSIPTFFWLKKNALRLPGVCLLLHLIVLIYFQAQSVYILFEHASGYALFSIKEFEEVGMLLPQVEEGVKDISKFMSVVKLLAFSPFKSGTNALDNMNSISEGKSLNHSSW